MTNLNYYKDMLRLINRTLSLKYSKDLVLRLKTPFRGFSTTASVNTNVSSISMKGRTHQTKANSETNTYSKEEEPVTVRFEELSTNNRAIKRYLIKDSFPDKRELGKLLEIDEDTQQNFEFIYRHLELEKNKEDIELLNTCAAFFNKKFVKSQVMVDKKPVVCIMGHVDHGKTTLLDYYRNTTVAAKEVGGITQKIGGFTLSTKNGQVSFIDTPGHELFSNMRETGVNCADIVVMIVAATEGVKPQTKEVFSLIKQYNLPYIIALNKVDLPAADTEMVEEELIELGCELEPYGGNVPCIHISAKTGENLDLLLELVTEESERLKLSADIANQPELRVIESKSNTSSELCKTSVVVKNGNLKIGQCLTFEDNWIKLMAMRDSKGNAIQLAEPGDIVEIIGISKLPQSSQSLLGFSNEKYCKQYITTKEKLKAIEVQNRVSKEDTGKVVIKYKNGKDKRKAYSNEANMVKKMMFVRDEILFELSNGELKADAKAKKQKNLLELNRQINSLRVDQDQKHIIIKAYDHGTLQAIENYLKSYEKQNFNILSIGCGELTSSEIEMAGEHDATIFLFDVKVNEMNESLIKQHSVHYHCYSIIYQLFEKLDEVNAKSVNEFEELAANSLGSGTALKIFTIPVKDGKPVKVCGSKVVNGYFQLDAKYRVVRNQQAIAEDLKVVSLKRFKREVEKVEEGQELGITFEDFDGFEEGDTIECYF